MNLKKYYLIPSFISFTISQLLERNVHFGTTLRRTYFTSLWFVYGVRQRFTIINLLQTLFYFRRALMLIQSVILARRKVLFINNVTALFGAVKPLAEVCGEPFCVSRWIGGTLSNFKKIWLALRLLIRASSISPLNRFKINLKASLEGIFDLTALPGVVFINSAAASDWALHEATSLRIPTIGIVDTDSDISKILYPIPGNDDSFSSIFFYNQLVSKTILICKMRILVGFKKKLMMTQRKTLYWRWRKKVRDDRRQASLKKRGFFYKRNL